MTNPDKPASRPVMIHRAILGSLERFIAIITEHFGGKWQVHAPLIFSNANEVNFKAFLDFASSSPRHPRCCTIRENILLERDD